MVPAGNPSKGSVSVRGPPGKHAGMRSMAPACKGLLASAIQPNFTTVAPGSMKGAIAGFDPAVTWLGKAGLRPP